ncbi:MAG: acyl-CoA dehydrogenase family protein [Bdellovibrionaceae bacterium]|nr:acyl-CoA dehydrogenase family protein [Pseudobdellovibrionaceae bacterium]
MNFNLSEDQLSFQSLARDFAIKEMQDHASEWDQKKIFPVEVIKKSAQMGFCGLYLKEDVGGISCSRLDTTLIFEELAKACPSTTAYISIHNMVAWMIDEFGSDFLRKNFVPSLASGEHLGAYCLTEPWSGSDAAGLKATAEKKQGEWILNGTKAFVSGAGSTQTLVVMARTGEPGPKGISCFVVPHDVKGLSYGKNEDKMGWNSQPTKIVNLDQVKIPEKHLLGKQGEGFKIAMKGLNGGRINIAICSVGAAQSAVDHSQQYMKEREQFGKSLSSFQALRFKIADMVTGVTTSRYMVRLAAFKLDQKDSQALNYCAMAKKFATDTCFHVCNEAIQIYGGYGYIKDYPLERLMRDARVHQILEGTNEIMSVILSRAILEENLFNF